MGHEKDREERLAKFVEYAKLLEGYEKGEAQVFLDRLFKAFGRHGIVEAGATMEKRVRNDTGGTSFADLVFKPVVLIEMKKRGEDLSRHLQQALDYWFRLVPNRPRYVVLCNFDEFRIYDFDVDINEPQDSVTLDELPTRYGPLAFLFPTNERPLFKVDRLHVTRQAADQLAAVYNILAARRKVCPETAQRFILQMLVALFSEDIGLLPKHFVTRLLEDCTDPPKAFELIGGLFNAMNNPRSASGGRFKEVPYFNGGIFSKPAPIELQHEELSILKSAARYNWAHVSPDIFGTIFQHSMGAKERHALGAHYTAPTDIMKIVGPTIVQPFTEAISRAKNPKELAALRGRLQSLRVLDPACGSGNFLYLAYREMRRLEVVILTRENQLTGAKGQTALGGISPKQFFGMDIIPFAVELAKVTLSLAPKLASDELHTTESTLPLFNLDANIHCKDALINADGSRADWPAADIIIGNPPFLGAKRLKPERGADYVNAVRKAYPEVPGMADYCVYWFRRAHDQLKPASPEDPFTGRAGLVGTQNIRNNQSRVGGLDHIVKSGVIVEAVENQPWSGEANVHVSIANWVKTPSPSKGEGRGEGGKPNESKLLIPSPRKLWQKVDPKLPSFEGDSPRGHAKVVTSCKRRGQRKDKSYELAFRKCPIINSALSDSPDVASARILDVNARPQRSFQGVVPGYSGFVLTLADRTRWLCFSKVVRPFMVGRDMLTNGIPSRAIIDFADMDMLAARSFDKPFDYIEKNVLPKVRETAQKASDSDSDMAKARADHLDRWWQFWNVRIGMRRAFEPLSRYLACARVTKRPVFVFCHVEILPDGALQTFAFNDDYSFGILQSNAHWEWFVAKCSKLKSDFRYTPESVFDTFPWPQTPTMKQVNDVAAAGREIRRIRAEALKNIKGGLRALYRSLELPGRNPLKDAHAALDAAVLEAYGFSATGDILKQLLDLNLSVAARIEKGESVTSPGVPPSYGDPRPLITDDCIQP